MFLSKLEEKSSKKESMLQAEDFKEKMEQFERVKDLVESKLASVGLELNSAGLNKLIAMAPADKKEKLRASISEFLEQEVKLKEFNANRNKQSHNSHYATEGNNFNPFSP
jgi:hypothetical protein